MCNKNNPRKIDACMVNLIDVLNSYTPYKILACCCGHGRYPMTIIFDGGYDIIELMSDKEISRKKRFYRKDKKGYYYIPEVSKEKQ